MLTKTVFILLSVLFLGTIFLFFNNKQLPLSFFGDEEKASPSDWVKEDQIKVYGDKIILNIPQATWASFTDTNSMDPLLDDTANALEIKPENPESIKQGDVISYQTEYGVVIHRVIQKSEDEKGVYFLVKGDNNTTADPNKVRFEDIKGVVVAVIY